MPTTHLSFRLTLLKNNAECSVLFLSVKIVKNHGVRRCTFCLERLYCMHFVTVENREKQFECKKKKNTGPNSIELLKS